MNDKRLKKFVRWELDRKFKWVAGLSTWVGHFLSERFMPGRLTANRVTLTGLFLCIPMTLFYLLDFFWLATVVLVVSATFDFADGALAHYQQGSRPPLSLESERRLGVLARIKERGVTHLGKSLDPITDKVRFFSALYVLGWGIVSGWLIIALTGVALALTVMRPIKRWLKMGDGRSNRFGKFKVGAEYVALGLLVLYPTFQIFLDVTLIAALTLGVCSLLGHVLSGIVVLRRRLLLRNLRGVARSVSVSAIQPDRSTSSSDLTR